MGAPQTTLSRQNLKQRITRSSCAPAQSVQQTSPVTVKEREELPRNPLRWRKKVRKREGVSPFLGRSRWSCWFFRFVKHDLFFHDRLRLFRRRLQFCCWRAESISCELGV